MPRYGAFLYATIIVVTEITSKETELNALPVTSEDCACSNLEDWESVLPIHCTCNDADIEV